MVQEGRRRPDAALSVRVEPVSLSQTTGRDYNRVLWGASTGRDATVEGNKDLQMSFSSQKRIPGHNTYRGDCRTNWIKRQRNGIARSHPDGEGTS